jgi:hypothetical protein
MIWVCRRFLDGIAGRRHRIRIMGAWPYAMGHQWRAEFLDKLLAAIRHNAVVEILILDPTSPAAMQRPPACTAGTTEP